MQEDAVVLVTGGAGFVGAQTALAFRERHAATRVIALDNLKRRGSELNLPRLAAGGVEFLHGDVRTETDLPQLKQLDLIIECSAEPSVLAGYGGSPRYVTDSNLIGAINCLELARKTGAAMIFLSTSRVYPIQPLCALQLEERDTRFEIAANQSLPGISSAGISEQFPLEGARSLYGATKFSAELFIAEYAAMYGLKAVINRCGVIAGPWQMGRVDQGILALWAARHLFGGALSYIGFGGEGKQVRDMLHVQDLIDLLLLQARQIESHHGHTANVGGGAENSVSLRELSGLCQQATGNQIPISADPTNRPADIPYYVTDNTRIGNLYPWQPTKNLETIVEDTVRWLNDQRDTLRPLFQ